LLLLMFTIAWRWLDRPAAVGIVGAAGAAAKLQPGIILAWALLTRRWAAAAIGVLVLLAFAATATLLVGISAWTDFVTLIARVSDPITTPHNFTPGAVAYQLGLPREAAAVLQLASSATVVVLVVVTALRLAAVPSYLVAVIASQLLSPILWDHYALLLLLPVAWLLDRGRPWAVLFVLATPVFLVGSLPAWVYPLAFWACLLAVVAEGASERRAARPAGAEPLAA